MGKTSDFGAEFEEHTINKDLDGILNNAKKQNIDFLLLKEWPLFCVQGIRQRTWE